MVQAEVLGGKVYKVGGGVIQVGEEKGRGEPEFWTNSATSVTEEVCVAPPSEVYRRLELETQPAWSWEPVGSRLPSPGAKRWWPHIDNTAETEVGVVEDPPDQVHAIEGRGRTS